MVDGATPVSSESQLQCVPFPAPGGASMIRFIVFDSRPESALKT